MIAAGIKLSEVKCDALKQQQACLDDMSAYLGAGICASADCELTEPLATAAQPVKDAYGRLKKLGEGKCGEAYDADKCKDPGSGAPPLEKKVCDAAQKPSIPGCTPTCDETKGTWACGPVEQPKPEKKACVEAQKPTIPGCTPTCDETKGTWACGGGGGGGGGGERTGFRWYDGFFLGYGAGLFEGFDAEKGMGIYPYVTESSAVTHRIFGGYKYPIEINPNWAIPVGVEAFGGWNPSSAPADQNNGISAYNSGPRTTALKHFGIGLAFGPEYRSDTGWIAGLQLSLGYKTLWGSKFDAGAAGYQEDVSFDTFYLAPQVYGGWKGIQLFVRPEFAWGDRYKEVHGMTTADYAKYRYGVGQIGSDSGTAALFFGLRIVPGAFFDR